MFAINPVLAGTFDAPDYAPAQTNFNTTAPSSTDGLDSRRYTQFDHSAADAGTVTDFTFSDFLDMVNPLQHIPVASSAYREATGETIKPVSRVVGDILYGGILGGTTAAIGGIDASAMFGGAGAVADATLEAKTGKDAGGNLIAALFGPGQNPGSQATQVASIASNGSAAGSVTPASPSSSTQDANPLSVASAFPLRQLNNLPYGGALSPPNMEAQDMAIALSAGSPTIHLGHTIYINKLVNGIHPAGPSPAASAAPAAANLQNVVAPPPTLPADLPATSQPLSITAAAPTGPSTANIAIGLAGTANTNQLPPALVQDMMTQALSQYGNLGVSAPGTGAMVDITH